MSVKLEGELDRCAMGILSQTCAEYVRSGVRELHLVVDGLHSIDPLIKADLMEMRQSDLTIRFQHPRFFLRKLLQSWGWLDEDEDPYGFSV